MTLDHDLVSSLEKFGQVLSVGLSEQQRVQAFLREQEVKTLERHLDFGQNKSFLMLGPSGCGKTAILHEFIRHVSQRDEPWLVLETSTTQIMSGTVYIGEWQTKLQELIDLAKSSRRIAVFCNDIFNMMGAGTTSKSDENMGDAIAPYVENGDFVLIGECTIETYRKGIERYPNFKKLFHVFRIKEQSQEDVRKVIELVADEKSGEVLDKYGVLMKFPENTLDAIQQFGEIYFPGRSPLGGAINLIDQYINKKQSALEDELEEHGGKTLQKSDKESLVQYEEIIQTLESFTGIPGMLLDDSRSLSLPTVREFFESRVIGQPLALSAVVDVITLIKAGLTDPQKPLNVMFFVGPTGVGKTELAKSLAEFIFGSPEKMIRLDMSEFKDYLSFHKLIGDQHARDDSLMAAGSLLAKVRQQPFSVILLDEIEKAHSNIFDLLLQLFDDGRLSDPQGRTTNFTQTLIVMTSNLGNDLATLPPVGFNREESSLDEKTKEIMKEFFRPEFLNRIDRTVHFQPLERSHAKIIAQRELGKVLLRQGITRRGLRVDVDPEVIEILVKHGFSEEFGARPLKRAVEEYALLPLARKIVHMTSEDKRALLRLVASGDSISVKIVKDRQARRQDALSKGVSVMDPIKGKMKKLKPKQIQIQMLELVQQVEALKLECEEQELEKLHEEFTTRTNDPDFWDDPVYARETLGELYRTERILESMSNLLKRTTDLSNLYEDIQERQRENHLKTVIERMTSIRHHAELIGYSLRCQNPLDRCDVFIIISAVGKDQPSDLVGNVADMYLNWTKLKGFPCKIVNEALSSPKITSSLTLQIDGVAIYGLLRAEEGIHEFAYGRNEENEKLAHYVKVRVVPIPDDRDFRLSDQDLSFQKEKTKGQGLRCDRYQSSLTLTHQPSLISVSGCSGLSENELRDLLPDLLRAEQFRRELIEQGRTDLQKSQDEEQIVRRYTVRPNQSAKDLRTGITLSNLTDLWNGNLDEFLNASVVRRKETSQGN